MFVAATPTKTEEWTEITKTKARCFFDHHFGSESILFDLFTVISLVIYLG